VHGYFGPTTTISQCNTVAGKLSTFFTSLFGGTGAQMCYNSQIAEIGGIIVAIIGLVVIISSLREEHPKRQRR
jgi:putative Mn2+ efflux pump MntP